MKALIVAVMLGLTACATSPLFDQVREVTWEGSTDIDMLKQVRVDLAGLRAGDTLRVQLTSPGGPVITSLEIARLVRQASDRGVIVEIHAVALCASGCTFVLASGTPGHRYIGVNALFLVHPPRGGYEGCVTWSEPKDEESKVKNEILREMLTAYMTYTGAAEADVKDWITCGHERIGGGQVAVSMAIADRVER